MTWAGLALIYTVSTLSIVSWADDQQVSVKFNQSTLRHALVENAPAPQRLEVSVSSWHPADLQLPSRISDTTNYQTTNLPFLAVNYLDPIKENVLKGNLSAVLGAGYMTLKRTGSLVVGNVTVPQQDTLQLVSLRLGALYEPSLFRGKRLSPFFTLSLLPTFAAIGRTVFNDGAVVTGWPLELGGGLAFKIFSQTESGPSPEITLGAVSTFGTIYNGSANGTGLVAGTRMAL